MPHTANMGKFRKGDVVRLNNGRCHMVVTRVSGPFIDADYIATPWYNQKNRHERDFVLIHQERKEETTIMAKSDLYRVIGSEVFGTMLAKTSDGKFALELKPSGEVKTYDPSEIEEVLPYTAALVPVAGGAIRHVEVTKGSVKVGDFLMCPENAHIFQVKQLDTKCKSSTSMKLVKLVVAPVN